VSPAAEDFWAGVPLGPGVSRVACDGNGLAALDKPEGVLSHPNGPRDEGRSLVRARYDEEEECFEWPAAGGERRLWLINRLDSATSGSSSPRPTARARPRGPRPVQRRRVRKVYQALVFGVPRQPAETWRTPQREEGGRPDPDGRGAGSLPAECRMTPGAVRRRLRPALSLIRLEPQTGRSHQLRVQCAKRGLPIVGDQTYGDFAANRAFREAGGPKRMFLHSLEVAFDYEFGGRKRVLGGGAPSRRSSRAG
jgi:tRNA pseudouridine65 synthase